MVIAKKTKDGVLVGISAVDSYIDMTIDDIMLEENQHFWKISDTENMYVFASHASRAVDVLRYNDEVFKGAVSGISVVKNVVPKMKEILDKQGLLIGGKEWDNQLIIINGKSIYKISRFFVASEEETFACVPRSPYAEGAIEETKGESDEKVILSVFKTTEEMNMRRLFPVTIFDVKKEKYTVYHDDKERSTNEV